MGASLFPSSSTLNTTTAPISATVTAGEAIKAGDLLTLAGDGLSYWATDPTSVAAPFRPMFVASDTYFSPGTGITTLSPSSVGYNENIGFAPVVLNDGGYLITWLTATAVMFTIFNKDGTVRVANVSLGARSFGSLETAPLSAKLLNNGNVFICAQGASGYLYFYIVSPDGSIVKSATLLEGVSVRGVDCAVLSGGNVAVAWISYASSSSCTTKYSVLSQAGDVVFSTASLSAPNSFTTTWARMLAICAQTDGTFVIAWYNYSSSAGANIQRFTATGSSSGSAVSVSSSSATAQKFVIAPLTGGGYALVYFADPYNAGNVSLLVYSSTLTLLKTITLTGASLNSDQSGQFITNVDITPTPDGGVALAWCALISSVATLYAAKYSAVGNVVVSPYAVGVTKQPSLVNTGQVIRIYLAKDGSQGFYITYVGIICQLDSSLNYLREAAIGLVAWGAPVALQWSDSLNDALLDITLIGAQNPSSSSAATVLRMQQLINFIRARVPIGVAQADAAKGATVSLTAIGSATTRLSMSKAYAADFSSSSGQKLSIIGNTAILKGIQP